MHVILIVAILCERSEYEKNGDGNDSKHCFQDRRGVVNGRLDHESKCLLFHIVWLIFCWPSHWGRPVVHGSICDNLDAYENPPIHPSTVVLAMHAPLLHPLWFDVTLLTRSDGVAVNIKLVGCVDRNAKRGYV